MNSLKASEVDLKRDIEDHIAYRPGNEIVVGLWMGYLLALLEYKHITIEEHARLVSLLPNVGLQEFKEMLGGVPKLASENNVRAAVKSTPLDPTG